MKRIVLIFSLFLLTACTQQIQKIDQTPSVFCGTSTEDICISDSDCTGAGCSGQVCQSSSTESSLSTCEYKECYNAQAYSLSCGCHEQKCSWG